MSSLADGDSLTTSENRECAHAASAVSAQDSMDAVIQAYVVHVMEGDHRALVPQYACHLRAGLRHLTYQVMPRTRDAGTVCSPLTWSMCLQ